MRRSVCALAIACLLGGGSSASAAIYRGTSSIGTTVKLRTNAQEKPNRVAFGPYEAFCSNHYDPVRNPIRAFVPPFDAVSPQRLLDRGRVNDRRDGYRVKYRWNFRARHTSGDRWVGRYRTNARFLSDGYVYTRCAVRFSFGLSRK